MSFAASTPTRLNFSNSVCSTQGLSAKVHIFGVVCVCFLRFQSAKIFFRRLSSLWIRIRRKDLLRARARFVTSRDVKLTTFSHLQAPIRTAKAFPSLKIENRVVVSSNTSSFLVVISSSRFFCLSTCLEFNLTLFLLLP